MYTKLTRVKRYQQNNLPRRYSHQLIVRVCAPVRVWSWANVVSKRVRFSQRAFGPKVFPDWLRDFCRGSFPRRFQNKTKQSGFREGKPPSIRPWDIAFSTVSLDSLTWLIKAMLFWCTYQAFLDHLLRVFHVSRNVLCQSCSLFWFQHFVPEYSHL